MIRVQIINERIGSLVLEDEDPRGLDSLEQEVKRSEDHDGLMYEITLSLDWVKKARHFIQQCYEADGIEAVIVVNLYERDYNARKWNLYYTGTLDLTKYSITNEIATLPIQQIGFQRKLLNLMDVDVDLETQVSQAGAPLPETPTFELEYHAKKILKGFDGGPNDGNEFQQLNVINMQFNNGGGDVYRDRVAVGNIDTSGVERADIEEIFRLPYGLIGIPGNKDEGQSVEDFLLENLNERFEFFRAKEAGLIPRLDISLRLKHEVDVTNSGGDVDICGEGALGNVVFQAWFEHRRENNTVVTLIPIGTPWTSPGCGGNNRETEFETKVHVEENVEFQRGDKMYVYYTGRVYGTYESPAVLAPDGIVHHTFKVTADKTATWIRFSMSTEFPATRHKTVMIYEALNKLVQYYTDQLDGFKSDFFGRIDTVPSYPVDGEGSLMGITNGRVLRNLENGSIFTNLEDALRSLNTAWCVGYGFEVIDGVNKFVIEKKSHFFDKDFLILELGVVTNLKKEVNMKYYYSQVELGFPKLDAGQINGIDEPNTVRKWVSPLSQAKNKLSLKSIWKSSGYEIEAQRRLQGSTQDSRNDESVFMTMLRRAFPNFETARNQDYTVVNNLYDPDSTYNLDLSPARCARRWLSVLAAPLWAVANKVYAFASGETNIMMETQKVGETALLKENGPLDANGVIPLWKPETYLFDSPLSQDEFKLIRNNPYGFIRFKDEFGNVMDGFILSVKHKNEENLGNFKLLRVFR